MPRIETYTATGTPGIQQAVEVSPNSFGAQGFRGVSELGQTVHAIGQKIQAGATILARYEDKS